MAALVAVTGWALATASKENNPTAAVAGWGIAGTGTGALVACIYASYCHVRHPSTPSALGAGLLGGVGALGGVVAAWLFINESAPHFGTGHIVNLAASGVAALLVAATGFAASDE
ncbi:hypothetical protein M427DRAFT_350577 [Gonapodya prolifera JEL478]|uniref:Uncharacterized protein n=1 Tax=Gonapodya prolifera (strain JEL478) TaxID=1344416 RepID=A0A139AWD0_GONPJ|nr:hypothetical protein M427DRAFT_350577 [Gonapodya prolifera JEL478]|eukprot:KXS21028.1 hypothetical protein M427DRAFT_350577 [Gonapodya prolifera JEL478]